MIVQNALLCGAPVIGIAADILGSSLVVNSGHVARPRNLTVSVRTKTARLCTHRDLVAAGGRGGARSGHYWW